MSGAPKLEQQPVWSSYNVSWLSLCYRIIEYIRVRGPGLGIHITMTYF